MKKNTMLLVLKVILIGFMMWLTAEGAFATGTPDRKTKRELRRIEREQKRVVYRVDTLKGAAYKGHGLLNAKERRLLGRAFIVGMVATTVVLTQFGRADD
jgi:hypothetical protein